jgi:NADPH:quinone reductase-like Zn-dependent oxidoreductase
MSTPATMRAWRIHGYGGPEVMRFEEAPVPTPGPGEILLRVETASVNPVDWKIREGYAKGAYQVTFPRVLGRDACGTIAARGADVSDLQSDERVAGVADRSRDGSHAEYVVLNAAEVGRVPAGVDEGFAAALGVAGLSAYIPLVEDARLAAGQRVLVQAGAGGVGSIAIQIARKLDAEVFATCGPANLEYVRGLGAQHALDYTANALALFHNAFDVVLDTLGGAEHVQSQALLKPGGALVCLNAAPIPDHAPRADIRIVRCRIGPTRERMERLLGWAADGTVRSVVTRTLPLAHAREAYAAVQSGHARGKLVLLAE